MNPAHCLTEDILTKIDSATGSLSNRPVQQRHLDDLEGCFSDAAAYDAALRAGNPLLYTVCSVEPADGDGQLHYGLGILHPGKIGDEYFMTKGHLHSWREAAEVYIGLAGEGMMLLEDESIGESRMVPLRPHHVVYVPGHTAHRTMNVGAVPLTYIGVYPARAGHDYSTIAAKNFRCLVVERDGQPTMIQR